MSIQTWQETLINAVGDGPVLVAAAAAQCIPPAAKITLPNNFFYVGRMLHIIARGRISNVITTPGTARFDVRIGGVLAFDSLAMPLNIVAKVNVPWYLDILLTCRAVGGTGATTNLMGQGTWCSESVIGSPLPTVGGSGSLNIPFNTAPVVGASFDNTLANTLDMFFTQTVATGSITLHQYKVVSLN